MSSTSVNRTELKPDQWRWTKKKDPLFHRKAFDVNLVKYHDQLVGGGKTARIFVPLCGKTLDMIFLADKGHEVVGLEFSKIGIEDFFDENNLTYREESVPGKPFISYTANERNITIFQGDLFNLTKDICGEFDASWDRGSFVAINIPTREKYAALMSSIIKKSGKILMEIIQYDPSNSTGPPHIATEKDLKELFKDFKIEILGGKIINPPPSYYKGDDFLVSSALLTHN